MKPHSLRARWTDGPALVNGWLAIPDPFAAEVMAHQGWDSLTIDLQHGVVEQAQLLPMLQAIQTTPTPALVRVPWLDPASVMKTLDAGALGVIAPMVNSREEAQRLVAYGRYAPRGQRSFGPVRAALALGADYAERADDEVLLLAMVETRQALDALDDILSVEGLDGVYVGPSDLSLSLGCKPSLDEPAPVVAQAIEHIVQRARAHGLQAGIHCLGSAAARARIALGYRLVTVASDARLLAAGSQRVLAEMRG